jgi:hypothetical protein
VAPVGEGPRQLPPAALAKVVSLLGGRGPFLSVHLYDPRHGRPDVVDEAFWHRELGDAVDARRVDHRAYLHRFRVTGAPYEMEAAVWRLRRREGGA